MAIEGGCLCGAVRYRIAAAPVRVRVCWCRLCQYIAAGNASVNATSPSQSFVLTGETADFVSTAESGSHMHRLFCPRCGTQISSAAEERPHLIVLRAGTLDDPELARPTATIWTKHAPSWAWIDPDIPRYDGQPPPA